MSNFWAGMLGYAFGSIVAMCAMAYATTHQAWNKEFFKCARAFETLNTLTPDGEQDISNLISEVAKCGGSEWEKETRAGWPCITQCPIIRGK